ncbi:MAG TPA: endonuclease/exonuclease/phosphatase family protein [Bacteroidota bacterium]
MIQSLRRRELSILFIVLIVVSGCAGTFGSSHRRTVRILTYNIHHAEGVDKTIDINGIGDVILKSDADIVALQDVDRWAGRTNNLDMMTTLADLTGMTYAFGESADLDRGVNGNGILTRFPILEERNLHFQTPASPAKGSLMQLVLDVGGITLVTMNTDLGFAESDSERVLDVQAIDNAAAGRNGLPVILCGSMNAEPGSGTYAILAGSFRDAWNEAKGEGAITVPSAESQKRTDYIFISKSVVPSDTKSIQTTLASVNARVLQSNASTHLPVLVELKIVTE